MHVRLHQWRRCQLQRLDTSLSITQWPRLNYICYRDWVCQWHQWQRMDASITRSDWSKFCQGTPLSTEAPEGDRACEIHKTCIFNSVRWCLLKSFSSSHASLWEKNSCPFGVLWPNLRSSWCETNASNMVHSPHSWRAAQTHCEFHFGHHLWTNTSGSDSTCDWWNLLLIDKSAHIDW